MRAHTDYVFSLGMALSLAGFACSPLESARPSSLPQASGDVMRGLELIDGGDRVAGLAELSLAQAQAPSYEGMLRIAMVMFLNGEFAKALEGYEAYLANQPQLPNWDRVELSREVERVKSALAHGAIPLGASLASRRLRGQLAALRGEAALERDDFRAAYQGFDNAAQYIPDPHLHLEAALAGTTIAQWSHAARHLRLFIEDGGVEIERSLAFAAQAEVDRLEDLAAGRQPVTAESLAEAIYAERRANAGPRPVLAAPVVLAESAPPTPQPLAESAPDSGEFRIVAGIGAINVKRTQEAGPVVPASSAEPGEVALPIAPAALAAPTTVDELLGYAASTSSAVRLRAVRDLVGEPDERARLALEEAVVRDPSFEVRRAAMDGLIHRGSRASIAALRRAYVGAATSSERAYLQRAIDTLLGVR